MPGPDFKLPARCPNGGGTRLPTSKAVGECRHHPRSAAGGARRQNASGSPSAPPPFGHLAGRLSFAIAPASARSRPTRHSGLALRRSCVALPSPGRMSEWLDRQLSGLGAPEIEGSTVLHRAFRPSQPNTTRSHESAQGTAFAAWLRQKVRIPESRRFGAWPGERSDRIGLTI
jgi:hypothetical protein